MRSNSIAFESIALKNSVDYSRIVTVVVEPLPENADGFLWQVASPSSTHFGLLWLVRVEGERPLPVPYELLVFDRSATTVRHGASLSIGWDLLNLFVEPFEVLHDEHGRLD